MTVAMAIAETMAQWIEAVKGELEAYPDEDSLWLTPGDVNNSAGNLALHLAGNLQAFIGAEMGQSGYVRDRPGEFGRRNVPRDEILLELERARASVVDTLNSNSWDLEEKISAPVFDEPRTRARWLLHLTAHLAYHHGQISYHRRIVAPTSRA